MLVLPITISEHGLWAIDGLNIFLSTDHWILWVDNNIFSDILTYIVFWPHSSPYITSRGKYLPCTYGTRWSLCDSVYELLYIY